MGRARSALRRAGAPGQCPCPAPRRRLALCIGAACAAWIDVAGARQGGGQGLDPPLLLSAATALSVEVAPAAKRASGKDGFRLVRELSAVPADDGSPAAMLRPATGLSGAGRRVADWRETAAERESPRLLRLAPELAMTGNRPPPAPEPRAPQPAVLTSFRAGNPGERAPRETTVAATRLAESPAAGDVATTPGPSAPLPPEDVRPGPPSPVSKDAATGNELPDLSAITSWAIPPVRWGGNTTSNYGWNGTSEAQTFSETQAASLRASSYIYQPWYAQVSGDLGLVTGSSTQSSTTSEGNQKNASKNTAVTYGGNLSLFPQSRFPFQAYVQSSDSRAQSNGASAEYTALRIGARQSYRPEGGQENYSGSADRSIVTSGKIRSIVDALQGNFSTTLGVHSLSANARYSRNLGDIAGQGSNLMSLAGSHGWRDDDEGLTVSSSAAYSNNQVSVLGADGLVMNTSQIMQAGSSVTWVPDEELPLTITGGGNILNLSTNTGTAAVALTNLNGFANASYRVTNNLMTTGGFTLSQNQSNGVSQMSSGQNASLSYMGDVLNFGNYFYNWGMSGNLANQIATGTDGSRSAGGSAQHSVTRQFILDPTSTISLNASQGYSMSTSSGTGQVGVLTHAGGASWRLALGERTAGTLSASASDSMSSGAFASHFRSLTTQGNLQAQLSARQTVSANMNFVVSQQLKTTQAPTTTGVLDATPPSTDNGNTTTSGSGSIAYMHRNPLDITNLMYTATLQVNASQSNQRLFAGDPNASIWQTGAVFQQTADYRIGRLIFRATSSFATLNGKENASVFFTIGREIGDL